MTARDVFISHSSDDADAARALRAIIEGAGYTCWMAPDDIVGTETWTEQILGAIADSRAMIVLISSASNGSPHVAREVNLALGKGRAVLPIRIEDVPPHGSLEYLLSLVQRVDAFPPPITNHRDRVMRRLQSIVAPGAAALEPTAPAPTPAPQPAAVPSVSPTPAASAPVAAPPPPAAQPPSAFERTGLKGPAPANATTPATPGAFRTRTPLLIGGVIAVVVIALLGASFIFKPSGPSPAPSQAAVATQGPGGTAALTPGPTAAQPTSGSTGSTLAAAEQQLVDRLPVFDRSAVDCASWPTPPGAEDVLSPSGYATSLARVTCAGPEAGAPQVRYAMYATKDALDADFKTIMSGQGVAAGGACATAIPANNSWNFPSFPTAGDLACYARGGGVQYVWTDHELLLLGQWLAPDNARGLAFWQLWERSRTAAEQALLTDLPASVAQTGPCVRAADLYYLDALAIVACPRPIGQNALFFARFPPADAYPNDPMTTLFFSILSNGGVPADTSTGCYESSFGRYTWGYKTNGVVGAVEGYLGCYQRSDTTPATAQIVWTFNRKAIMGLWDAPDVDTATKLFDTWITEVK